MSKQNPIEVLTSLSNAISQVTENVGESVVRISSGRRGGGTGIIWSKQGQIVTAAHVVGRSQEAEVGLPDGRSLNAKILGLDPYSDIALLKVEAEDLKPIIKADSEKLRPGEFVLALASAFGPPVSVTSGIITSPKRSLPGFWGNMLEDVIVTDAPLNPGYSGGPLINAEGEMIGLNTAYMSNRGIAIPSHRITKTVERLQKNGSIKRAYLGIVTEAIELPEEAAKEAKLDQESGLIVLHVVPDSPARRGGLLTGDILLTINNQPAADLQDLHQLLDEDLINKPTQLRVLRSEKTTTLTITPSEAKE